MKSNISLFLLFTLYFANLKGCPTSLGAVEGNEPVPELELPLPELEETLKIWQSDTFRCTSSKIHFPDFYLGLKFGESELGEGYNIKIGGCTGINNSFTAQFLEIEDRTSLGAGIEIRTIGTKSILEVDVKTDRYNVGTRHIVPLQALYLANSSLSFYQEANVFKLLTSACYESEALWDLGVLWGRKMWEPLFIGIGISAPIVAPFVQMNWKVNDLLSINLSHRSKKVTSPLESIYMNQPYVVLNPDLKHERWSSFSDIKFLLGDNVNIELSHKWIENTICWEHRWWLPDSSVLPVNKDKLQEWKGKIDFELQKIKNEVSFEYKHLKHYSPYIPPLLHTFIPTISFINVLEVSLFHNISIGIESKYNRKKFVFSSWDWGTMSDYWLFSLELSKKLRNWELWIKINNLTNTKYEIIKLVDGPGKCIQAGFNIEM